MATTDNKYHVFIAGPSAVLVVTLTIDQPEAIDWHAQDHEMVKIGTHRFRRSTLLGIAKASDVSDTKSMGTPGK